MGNRNRTRTNGARRGLTLIELLVAIAVVLLLVAVALPLLTPGQAARRIREASRSINVYFGAARAKAMELGREVGVALERDPNNLSACTKLVQVESPPPYAGETQDARLRLYSAGKYGDGKFKFYARPWDVGLRSESGISTTMYQKGDLVKIGSTGVFCSIENQNTFPMELKCTMDPQVYPYPPWPATPSLSEPVPFAIYRQPTISPEAAPLILPKSTAIDLGEFGSGLSLLSNFARVSGSQVVNDRVLILFSPQGSVSRVLLVPQDKNPLSLSSSPATEPILLLVGERTRVGLRTPPAAVEAPNWAAVDSLWVTLIPQTGFIRAAENVPPASINLNNSSAWTGQPFRDARMFALGNRKSGNTDIGSVEDLIGGR